MVTLQCEAQRPYCDFLSEPLGPTVSSWEVKYSAAMFDIAGRQNAHSMFIIALSPSQARDRGPSRNTCLCVSHGHLSARIYGYYYFVIDGKDTKYFRHLIRDFSFTEMDSKEKWTAGPSFYKQRLRHVVIYLCRRMEYTASRHQTSIAALCRARSRSYLSIRNGPVSGLYGPNRFGRFRNVSRTDIAGMWSM